MKKLLFVLGAAALALIAPQMAQAQAAPAKKKTAITAVGKKKKKSATAAKAAPATATKAKPAPMAAAAPSPPPPPPPAAPPAPPVPTLEERRQQINALLQNFNTTTLAKEQLEESHAGGGEDIYYQAGVGALAPQVQTVNAALASAAMQEAMTPEQRTRYQELQARYAAKK